MQVVLKPELEKFVQEGVALKRYKSADAMVEEALRLLQAQEREDAEKLEALRRDVQVGLDQLDRGEYIEVTDSAAFMKAFLARVNAKHIAKQADKIA